jgi:hypothetical protein
LRSVLAPLLMSLVVADTPARPRFGVGDSRCVLLLKSRHSVATG